MKAPRNKTIDLSVKDGKEYLDRCLTLKDAVRKDQIKDRVIRGDFFKATSLLPSGFADLVIADPPYNLDKTFSSAKFSRMDDDEYGAYTESWVKLIRPFMKDTATIYVCCDWKSIYPFSEISYLNSSVIYAPPKMEGHPTFRFVHHLL